MKTKFMLTKVALLPISFMLFFSCSKTNVGNSDQDPVTRDTSTNPIEGKLANLVTTDWKGIVWDPYNKDWTHPVTIDDAKEIASAGIQWARIWVTAGTPDAVNDAMVALCNANKIKIVACYNKLNPYIDLGDVSQQAEQVDKLKAFVSRYKSTIKYYEIGNEPNLLSYWNIAPGAWDDKASPREVGRGSSDPNSIYNAGVRRYVQWLHLAYDAIKSTDPAAKVIMGGVSSYIMSDFMDRFTIEKGYQYFDEVAFHPYDKSGPDGVINQLKAFKVKMKAWPAAKSNAPIWITEIGFQDGDENLKAKNLTGMMTKLTQNLTYSRPIFWYILHDNTYALINQKVNGSEIITTYLPAYTAYKNLDKSWAYYSNGGQ